MKTFWVTGTGQFPMDMLRYDEAEILNHNDRERVAGEQATCEQNYVRIPRRTIAVRGERCTDLRWNSFGWGVSNQPPQEK